MKQANELRIGNWVKQDGDIEQVTFKTFELLNDIDTYYVAPIPLTEDILLKCGFEKRNNSYFLRVQDLKSFEYYMETIFDDSHFFAYISIIRHLPKGGEEIKTEKRKLNIKFLHQLQNLYFALTGKELEVIL